MSKDDSTKHEINEIVDYIMKSLGAFATLAIAWVALDSLANVTGAVFLHFLSGIAFISALVALFAIVGFAGYLLAK